MQNVDCGNFDFGKRPNDYIHEVMNYGGALRTELELTEVQKVFLRAVKREMVKYAAPNRHGYPHNLLEQMGSFTRTIGDLHNSYFDSGMRNSISKSIRSRRRVADSANSTARRSRQRDY